MIGIVSYGVYVPLYRIKAEEIAKQWNQNPESIKSGLLIEEKSVPDTDEDTATMAVQATRAAIKRADINPKEIGAIYVGSESHPYAVKPTGTIVGAAINARNSTMVADLEFACKAGTAGMQVCLGFVEAWKIKYGLAIGADVSQSAPGDALEYTAGAGAGAFIIGRNNVIAEIECYSSFTSDTPDFWRRDKQQYPRHAGRFTGDPAYFRHTISAARVAMEENGFDVKDFDHAVFHQPNGKFPRKAAKELGFIPEQIEQGLVVQNFGNTYSACSLIGLANVLDNATSGQLILMVSFGSGAGSDAFVFKVTDLISEIQQKPQRVKDFVSQEHTYLDYGRYTVHQKKINM